jgi:hypothetical protein
MKHAAIALDFDGARGRPPHALGGAIDAAPTRLARHGKPPTCPA